MPALRADAFKRVKYECMYIDGRSVDIQYSNWTNGQPQNVDTHRCVVVTQNNEWLPLDCNEKQRYVCQS